MITPEILSQVLSGLTEKIPLCGQLVAEKRCNWDCCQYTNSYILFLPGEFESARSLGYDTDHYTILDANYHGGVKAVPRSMGCCVDPAHGNNAYKSLDCRLFPYWFQLEHGNLVLLEGLSCPIIQDGLPIHAAQQEARRVAELLSGDDDIAAYLSVARMVNYRTMKGVSLSHSTIAVHGRTLPKARP